MTLLWTRRKQTSKEYPDGKWHRVPTEPRWMRDRVEEEKAQMLEEWRYWNGFRNHPTTFCGQAYISKYWITTPDHDHFREVCEDCQAEIAAQVLIGKLVLDDPSKNSV